MFIEKRASEAFYRYHQFKRTDGNGWLGVSETISSCSVIVLDSSNINMSSSMVDSVATYDSTQVIYKLKGGIVGKVYTVIINIVTSDANVFEDSFTLKVT